MPARKAGDPQQRGQKQRHGGDGQAEILSAAAGGGILPLLLVHIEPRQTNEGAESIQAGHDGGDSAAVGSGKNDGGGKHAEADEVAEGVDLHAEAPFLRRSVLFCGSDRPVEHIKQPRQKQAEQCPGQAAPQGQADARKACEHADIGQNHRVIINTQHCILSPFSIRPLGWPCPHPNRHGGHPRAPIVLIFFIIT